MASITKNLDVTSTGASFDSGDNTINVMATSDGLTQSAQSNPVTFNANYLIMELSTDGTYYIFKGHDTTYGTTVVIPDTYNGKPVKEIAESIYHEMRNITSLTIGANVEIIRASAFYKSSLANLSFASGSKLKTIEADAFAYSELRDHLTLPSMLETIGERAFNRCSGIESVSIPYSVTSIGEMAFAYCSYMTDINLPQEVQFATIPTNTFRDCSSLQHINVQNAEGNIIPNGVITIQDYAFQGTRLDSIKIGHTVNFIGRGAFLEAFTPDESTAEFLDPYGWFSHDDGRTENNGFDDGVHYDFRSEAVHPQSIAEMLNELDDTGFYKIDQMVAPTISISGRTLTITDPTGIATEFYIYVNGVHEATMDATTGTVTPV